MRWGVAAAVAMAAMAGPGLAEGDGRGGGDGARWDGWRAGVHAGAAFAETDYRFSASGARVGSLGDLGDEGFVVGGSAGYDRDLGGGWLIGIGGAVEVATVSESGAVAVPGGSVRASTDYMLTARVGPRVGKAFGTVLVYADAGLAAAYVDQRIESPLGEIDDASGHLGWTVGAGVETALSERLSLTAEARLTDLSAFTYKAGGFEARTSGRIATATVGLTWRF